MMKIRYKHIKLGQKSRIKKAAHFEGYNKVGISSFFDGEIGLCSYIGTNSIVIGKVGRFCSISDKVVFLTKTHPIDSFVSTHPAFYSLKKQSGISFVNYQKFDEEPCYSNEKYSIIVGNDVYIGYGAVIIGPVKIGDGAVICANAVVTKDVPPYSVVG